VRESICVAASGGMDSMVLAEVCVGVKEREIEIERVRAHARERGKGRKREREREAERESKRERERGQARRNRILLNTLSLFVSCSLLLRQEARIRQCWLR